MLAVFLFPHLSLLFGVSNADIPQALQNSAFVSSIAVLHTQPEQDNIYIVYIYIFILHKKTGDQLETSWNTYQQNHFVQVLHLKLKSIHLPERLSLQKTPVFGATNTFVFFIFEGGLVCVSLRLVFLRAMHRGQTRDGSKKGRTEAFDKWWMVWREQSEQRNHRLTTRIIHNTLEIYKCVIF